MLALTFTMHASVLYAALVLSLIALCPSVHHSYVVLNTDWRYVWPLLQYREFRVPAEITSPAIIPQT